MTRVRLEAVTHHYPGTVALDDVTLDICRGGITSILGPSGCGKTTVLKLIGGLLRPTVGTIRFDGRDVTEVAAERREAVMVFQDHRLFPFLTVLDNVAFGLRMQGIDRRRREHAATEMLERVGLDGFAPRRPASLSGGQRQRVALARALVLKPRVLLLDEPLSNLDTHLRDEMRDLIRDIHDEHMLTTITVTHDQQEAVALADEIALLLDGRLEQHGAPRAFFERPATARAAAFFGNPNLVPGVFDGTHVETPVGRLRPSSVAPSVTRARRVGVVLRPERLRVGAGDGRPRVQGTVTGSTFLGTRVRARVDVAGHQVLVDASDASLADVGPGTHVELHIPDDAVCVVPPDAGSVPGQAGADEAPVDESGVRGRARS